MGVIERCASDYKLMGDDILREITVLALPALIAQAADPVAQLLETVYIGRIGTTNYNV